MTNNSTNPTPADFHRLEEPTTMSDPQRAAVKIAASLASGSVPRETSRSGLGDQLGVHRPRRRRGRSEESKALAAQILDAEDGRR